jgi:Ni,Fe-hydrogenase III large subunit
MMIANGQAARIAEIEALEYSRFEHAIAAAIDGGARVVAQFGLPNYTATVREDAVLLFAVLGWDEQARLEILSGLAHTGAVELPRATTTPAPERAHTFRQLLDPTMHEVAVGPVHAGVIEPGHFRFQCLGETALNLEILLGYQHRGVELSLLGQPGLRQLACVQEIAGDTTVGHALAYCQLIEALSGTRATPRAHGIRAIALELERMANHVGDLGALAGDIGYQPTAAVCGRLRGAFLNLTAEISGNRFARWLLTPGGVRADIAPAQAELLISRLAAVTRQFERAADRFLDAPGVLHRLEGTGTITIESALELGLVGVAARACGLTRDVRHDYPHGYYTLHQIPIAFAWDGDVYSRTLVRRIEAMRASDFVREALTQLPEGELQTACGPLRGELIAVSLVEGWRGEIAHIGVTDAAGRIVRYKVIDPSSHNWSGLEIAMRGQQISDFPLCNKSFNLSYAGNDL